MREGYSSLFKGTVHITTEFGDKHQATDYGNYKTKNPIFSPERMGIGKVTKITTTDKYNGITYNDVLSVWVQYGIYEACMTHGEIGDKVVNVGDSVIPGQQIYRTGNKGCSKGDHYHYQLKENGILIDPSVYTFNDKDGTLAPGAIPYSITPPNALELQKLQEQVNTLQSKLDELAGQLVGLQGQLREKVEQLKVEKDINEENEKELTALQKRHDILNIDKNRIENERDEAIKKLNECKNGRFFWLISLLEKWFPSK